MSSFYGYSHPTAQALFLCPWHSASLSFLLYTLPETPDDADRMPLDNLVEPDYWGFQKAPAHNRPISDPFIRGLAGGVPLVELGTTTRKCKVEQLGKYQFRIVLTQGLNRQIRRMCEYFGYRVEKLVRVRIMNISLGDLEPGKYRQVTPEEYKKLTAMLAKSSNQPAKERGRKYGK